MNTMVYYKSKIKEGDYHSFLCSKAWKEKRIEVLNRDSYECQRCKGVYDGGYPVDKIRLTRAVLVHHHVAAQENVELVLDDDNLVSLCWRCHEIVEGRVDGFIKFIKKKKPTTEEKW